MIGRLFSIVALSLLASQANAATANPVWAADVPMLSCDGVPCVTAQIGTAPAGLAVIDTGDVGSVVDSTDAAAIGFDSSNLKGGQIHAAHPNATVGGVTLESVPAIALPLKQMIVKGEMPHTQFTLAYPAFKDRVLQLDFLHHRVRISDVLAAPLPCTANCASFHLITFGKQGPPIVVADGFSVNGKRITVQIDSDYAGALLIYSASIEKLGLSEAAKTGQVENFPYTDGGVKMKKSVAQTVGFGGRTLAVNAPLYFPTPGVHEPDALFDGTVGLALMQNKIVTLDFHDMTISVSGG